VCLCSPRQSRFATPTGALRSGHLLAAAAAHTVRRCMQMSLDAWPRFWRAHEPPRSAQCEVICACMPNPKSHPEPRRMRIGHATCECGRVGVNVHLRDSGGQAVQVVYISDDGAWLHKTFAKKPIQRCPS